MSSSTNHFARPPRRPSRGDTGGTTARRRQHLPPASSSSPLPERAAGSSGGRKEGSGGASSQAVVYCGCSSVTRLVDGGSPGTDSASRRPDPALPRADLCRAPAGVVLQQLVARRSR